MADVGYLELLRTNRDYRRIWFGDIASLLGDWFNTIALYTLVGRLTGSPFALGLVFLCKMVPFALASPVAGLLADRFNRRRLMIGADLLRAVIVLGFLLVRDPGDVWLLYSLTALQVVISSVFLPARSASIPNVTSERELLTANALSAATWSTLLAVGAALGGFATDALGVQAVFVLDSLSYCVSAFFLWRAHIPQHTEAASKQRRLATALREIGDGWKHMRREPRIGRMALAKASWAMGGGALVFMLALVGEAFRPAAPAVGIGLLYAARGLGTGLGPILARRFVRDERRWPTLMGLCTVTSGVAYLALSSMPWQLFFIALVLVAHTTSGANWVVSTVSLQRRTADRYRGRVFATEWLLLTLVDSVAILCASLLLESGLLDLRAAIMAFALLQISSGALWLLLIVPRERREGDVPEDAAATLDG